MVMGKEVSSSARPSVVFATLAGLIFAMAVPPLAKAGPSEPASRFVSASMAPGGATDFSAARRHRHYRHGSNAAGLAFMGMAIGAIGAIAAQQRRQDYYDNGYGYGPGYYGGGPYYHSQPYYYGRRYYRIY